MSHEQMWIDVGKLIREHAPDKNGNALPPDLTSGSYEFRDLTNTGVGTLFEGKIIYDKTYGHVVYGCGTCCGYAQAKLFFNPLGVPLSLTSGDGVDGYENCSLTWDDVSDSFYNKWSTAYTAIATVDYYGTHTGVSVASTTSNTLAYLDGNKHAPLCPQQLFNPSGGVNAVAIPVNFRQVNVSPLSNGILQFVYEWDSSSGKTSDLANCVIGEIVTYPGIASPYVWTSPPYNQPNPLFPNPFTSSITATNVLIAPYNHTGFADNHDHPTFRTPYKYDDFVSTQYYRFSCTNYQAGAWVNMAGPISIERTVKQNSNGTWQYTVMKSGSSASVNPLP